MMESFTHFLLEEHLFDATFDPPTGPIGYTRQLDPSRQPFPTNDGHVSIAPYSDTEFVRLLICLGGESHLASPALETAEARASNVAGLFEAVRQFTSVKSTEMVTDLCRDAGIAAMKVTGLQEILDNKHLQAIGFFERSQHPTEGGYLRMRPPVRFSVSPPTARHAPLLDEHGDEIRAELRKVYTKA
jgi:crotonobetainyl-CoA:carnitine CoA-transferase CaiB-like acyl-CoA transferase